MLLSLNSKLNTVKLSYSSVLRIWIHFFGHRVFHDEFDKIALDPHDAIVPEVHDRSRLEDECDGILAPDPR